VRSRPASKLLPSITPALATGAGPVVIFPAKLRRVGTAAGLVAVGVTLFLANHVIVRSFDRIRELDPLSLALAFAALLAALASSAGAWRCALRSAGGIVGRRATWACYGLGSLANTALPARLGDAVRVGLYASRIDRPDRLLLCAGACLTVAIARAVVWTLTCAVAGAAGLLPYWMVAAPVAFGVVVIGARLALGARTGRVSRALAGSIAPACCPRLLVWASVAAAARIVAAAEVLVALGVPHPVHAAVVGLTALAAANIIPVGPGAAGVAGTGMALALTGSGVPAATAIAAAVSFHAVETLATVAFGGTGFLAERSVGRLPRRGHEPAEAIAPVRAEFGQALMWGRS
jgi:uncharacterized membrane protein YbhN (UPF0104 family)